VRRTSGQWRMAVRPPASAHRPRGTGLSPSRASLAVGDSTGLGPLGSSGTSACACGPGTASRRGGRAGDVVRGFAWIQTQFHLALFKMNFLQIFKQKCSKL
jgi:hypothetical protein